MRKVLSSPVLPILLLILLAGGGAYLYTFLPSTTVKRAIDQYRSGDLPAFTRTMGVTMEDLRTDLDADHRLFRPLRENLDVEILDQKYDLDTALVRVRGTNLAMDAIVADMMSLENLARYGSLSDEAMEREIANMMTRSDAPTRTREVDVYLERINGKWRFSNGRDDLLNIMLGYGQDVVGPMATR